MQWKIDINNLGLTSFAPAYWKDDYPTYGNKNMAAEMFNIDATNPSYLTQGPGLVDISGSVDQLIKGILKNVFSENKSVGIGGTKVYEITPTTITEKSVGTISGGEDVSLRGGKIYYSWDTNIGQVNDDWTSYDEDWWTSIAGGSALTSGVPHQLLTAGTSGVMTILNGSVVASWDGSTASDTAFDTKDDNITLISQVWNGDRFYFAGNKPNTNGRNEGSIFIWDGASASWDYRIKIDGKIGALYVRNGVVFVFYRKNVSESVSTLGYVNDRQIIDVANYAGLLPAYYQIDDYRDFIIWSDGYYVFAWGAGGVNIPTRIFQIAPGSSGGLSNPFGSPIIAFSNGVKKFSGYTTDSSWKSITYDIAGINRKGFIEEVIFSFEKLQSGASVDWVLRENSGNVVADGNISFSNDGAITKKHFYPKASAENIRIELDFSGGSATNPVKIKRILIKGNIL